MARAQGSDYVAAIASYTLGALVQLAPIRGALLKGQGVRPLVHCLRDADAVLPGESSIRLYHVSEALGMLSVLSRSAVCVGSSSQMCWCTLEDVVSLPQHSGDRANSNPIPCKHAIWF